MKVVIQRVKESSVTVDNAIVGSIQTGLMVLVGFCNSDSKNTVDWMCNKICNMRIFADEQQLMNRSLIDINGALLLVSQFTLYGDAAKGNRPSFIQAAKPPIATPLYEYMIQQLNKLLPIPIATGIFGADMQVALVNDGPVTILLEK